MTDKVPADWILIEAAKRGKRLHLGPDMLRIDYNTDKTYRALCDMIERYEEPPEDRKLLCAREAYKRYSGVPIPTQAIGLCVAAIELYEEGFGK
jgi:hypothetical protein